MADHARFKGGYHRFLQCGNRTEPALFQCLLWPAVEEERLPRQITHPHDQLAGWCINLNYNPDGAHRQPGNRRSHRYEMLAPILLPLAPGPGGAQMAAGDWIDVPLVDKNALCNQISAIML